MNKNTIIGFVVLFIIFVLIVVILNLPIGLKPSSYANVLYKNIFNMTALTQAEFMEKNDSILYSYIGEFPNEDSQLYPRAFNDGVAGIRIYNYSLDCTINKQGYIINCKGLN